MNTKSFFITADDFTGSNDTGVQLRKRGIPVEVTLNPPSSLESGGSLVLDTESRNIYPQDAYQKVKRLVEEVLQKNQFDLVYKKVDSTLRGNIVDEVQALREVYQPDIILFAPAYPSNGRVTREGVLYLNGTPLMETEIAKDPLHPIKTDNIYEMMKQWQPGTVRHHSLEEVSGGKLTLEGAEIHTFDADSTDDLRRIGEAGLALPEKVLWVGSAGLADAIFNILSPRLPALAVVGSISQTSLDQMTYAESQGVQVVQIPIPDLFDKSSYSAHAHRIVQLLKTGDAIVTATRSRQDYEDSLKYALKEKGISKEDSSWYVQTALSTIAKEVVGQVEMSGLYLTGGDTAIAVIDAFGAEGCIIHAELLTGTVLATLKGGVWPNLPIVTKAGAFGKPDNLYYCMQKLGEKIL